MTDIEQLLKGSRTFREWLQGQDADTCVGLPGKSCECPLARFLQAHGHSQVTVEQSYVHYPGGRAWSPWWVQVFVDEVDHAAYVEERSRISVRDALGALDIAEHERDAHTHE